MSLRRSVTDVSTLLGALRVPYDITSVYKNITVQYVIKVFGTVVSVITPNEYGAVSSKVEDVFKGYRQLYFATSENISEKRYEIIWELMRSGYMKWLRHTYGPQFSNIIETDNLGGKIINERLKVWDYQPKYLYLITENLEAQGASFRRILAEDPAFFDYMPEVEGGIV